MGIHRQSITGWEMARFGEKNGKKEEEEDNYQKEQAQEGKAVEGPSPAKQR